MRGLTCASGRDPAELAATRAGRRRAGEAVIAMKTNEDDAGRDGSGEGGCEDEVVLEDGKVVREDVGPEVVGVLSTMSLNGRGHGSCVRSEGLVRFRASHFEECEF